MYKNFFNFYDFFVFSSDFGKREKLLQYFSYIKYIVFELTCEMSLRTFENVHYFGNY